ncbi:unnamed protein product [Cylindrotheca closterium]|uniref:IMP-specific 5'-nucleotidase 1 n=1 Tax=Cylindrotheca closterium TaxID=2856 RepID=A0AAD2CQG2_9STRA|nr:unnamed protein product [Cylindrotheca closterium]
MSFSSRRRNYLLTPHRRDGLIEWMKSMLMHSFVLDALETSGGDTFSHFELLIDEHRRLEAEGNGRPSRLKQLVPTVGTFHTRLPLRQAFEVYNEKYKLTKRKHIQISFNEIRHIMNLAQVMAMRKVCELKDVSTDGDAQVKDDAETTDCNDSVEEFNGPKMITFDGDQTLYTDGSNFDSNPRLANYLYELVHSGVTVAVVTAAGYEYKAEKYEFRLSGLLNYFKSKNLTDDECHRFYLFGGECNYLLRLGNDFRLHPVREAGPGGWVTGTKYIPDTPGNWSEEEIKALLDASEIAVAESMNDQNLKGIVIRKKRSIGLAPQPGHVIPREALDETVLRCQSKLSKMNQGSGSNLPFCAFNGGRDVWVDVGNKKVGVQVLGAYLGVDASDILHIGDQFLNTGNDYAARSVCPCIWITSPEETTYILKRILKLAGVVYELDNEKEAANILLGKTASTVDFAELDRRTTAVKEMDVFTGDFKN